MPFALDCRVAVCFVYHHAPLPVLHLCVVCVSLFTCTFWVQTNCVQAYAGCVVRRICVVRRKRCWKKRC